MSSLFPPNLPDGFSYREAFIDFREEAALAESIERIEFSTFEMRGVVARRRVAFFGRAYDNQAARPWPDFLMPLRERAARWAGVESNAFVMALINEYRPGATIGWHRDAPQYGIVAGVSLLSSCRMRLRPYTRPAERRSTGGATRRATHEVRLEPRSAYLIQGLARNAYEHSIPGTKALRYSITFRTYRTRPPAVPKPDRA
jgi:alkylated DNA repair dioxygenase AlkB